MRPHNIGSSRHEISERQSNSRAFGSVGAVGFACGTFAQASIAPEVPAYEWGRIGRGICGRLDSIWGLVADPGLLRSHGA